MVSWKTFGYKALRENLKKLVRIAASSSAQASGSVFDNSKNIMKSSETPINKKNKKLLLPFLFLSLYNLFGYIMYALLFFPALLQMLRGRFFWAERLGLRLPCPRKIDLWLHAASRGEVQLLYPLVQFLRKKKPGIKIHITVTTPAGYETAQRNFNFASFSSSYLPLDIKPLLLSLLEHLRPEIVVITESEHWLQLLRASKAKKLPVLLVNGRISQASCQRLRVFPSLCNLIFSHYSYLFLKSDNDCQRYLDMHVSPQKIVLAGDLKFDAPLQIISHKEITQIRRQLDLGKEDFLLVAGSTRPPKEEAILIDIFRRLKDRHSRRIKLILAPRHLQRLDSVKKLLSLKGVDFSLYSAQETKKNCILMDQMGLLSRLYGVADLSFVGGTMANTGGHNILEPVWAGTPVLFGPDVRNIPDMVEYVLENNYGAQAKNPQELLSLIDQCITKQRKFKSKSKAEQNNSATHLLGSAILELLQNKRF